MPWNRRRNGDARAERTPPPANRPRRKPGKLPVIGYSGDDMRARAGRRILGSGHSERPGPTAAPARISSCGGGKHGLITWPDDADRGATFNPDPWMTVARFEGYLALWLTALLTAGSVSGGAGPYAAQLPAYTAQTATDYYPGPGDAWERREPAAVGMDAALLDSAVAFAIANESAMGRDLREFLTRRFEGRPYNEIIGPMKERGGPNGLVLRHGYIVAEWGDTRRVDMTFSVTKSFLSAVAGLAFDRGMIRDVDDPVRDYVDDGGFDSPHNSTITWRQLLQQTNEWEGTLWGKPDVADRRRGVDRELREPGTFWEYNDVRVNRTALSALRIWRRSLPSVLKSELMDPIDASDTWEWHGYRNSFVEIDGEQVQSVSGGGHWGGGMWISSRDLARFGYLYLRGGNWRGRQILSQDWIDQTLTPTDIRPRYGFMWWLNTDLEMWPSVPETSFAALGGGSNAVWVEREHDLVVVVRWIEASALDGLLSRVLASLQQTSSH